VLIDVRSAAAAQVHIPDCTEIYVSSEVEVMDLMREGAENRATATTSP